MNNPFTLSFGKEPIQLISRLTANEQILNHFEADIPSNQTFMITGIRGTGKTVLLTSISKHFKKQDNWVVIELNPTRDLLQALAAKLYSIPELETWFINAKLNLSLFGIGAEIEKTTPISDIETAIERMLAVLQKKHKKLLITIDEVTNNEYMKIFASAFQIFIRNDYPMFLLMTGLYENINNLQNDKSLTFLYRAPKIALTPLSIRAIKSNYMSVFHIEDAKAQEMAALTMGYPFAFQVLGYLYWEHEKPKNLEELYAEYDQYLEEYVYEKIWSELSEIDRKVIHAIANCKTNKIKDIREVLEMNSSLMSVYRDRLEKRGIIDTSKYGNISLALPRFAEIVEMWA